MKTRTWEGKERNDIEKFSFTPVIRMLTSHQTPVWGDTLISKGNILVIK